MHDKINFANKYALLLTLNMNFQCVKTTYFFVVVSKSRFKNLTYIKKKGNQ